MVKASVPNACVCVCVCVCVYLPPCLPPGTCAKLVDFGLHKVIDERIKKVVKRVISEAGLGHRLARSRRGVGGGGGLGALGGLPGSPSAVDVDDELEDALAQQRALLAASSVQPVVGGSGGASSSHGLSSGLTSPLAHGVAGYGGGGPTRRHQQLMRLNSKLSIESGPMSGLQYVGVVVDRRRSSDATGTVLSSHGSSSLADLWSDQTLTYAPLRAAGVGGVGVHGVGGGVSGLASPGGPTPIYRHGLPAGLAHPLAPHAAAAQHTQLQTSLAVPESMQPLPLQLLSRTQQLQQQGDGSGGGAAPGSSGQQWWAGAAVASPSSGAASGVHAQFGAGSWDACAASGGQDGLQAALALANHAASGQPQSGWHSGGGGGVHSGGLAFASPRVDTPPQQQQQLALMLSGIQHMTLSPPTLSTPPDTHGSSCHPPVSGGVLSLTSAPASASKLSLDSVLAESYMGLPVAGMPSPGAPGGSGGGAGGSAGGTLLAGHRPDAAAPPPATSNSNRVSLEAHHHQLVMQQMALNRQHLQHEGQAGPGALPPGMSDMSATGLVQAGEQVDGTWAASQCAARHTPPGAHLYPHPHYQQQQQQQQQQHPVHGYHSRNLQTLPPLLQPMIGSSPLTLQLPASPLPSPGAPAAHQPSPQQQLHAQYLHSLAVASHQAAGTSLAAAAVQHTQEELVAGGYAHGAAARVLSLGAAGGTEAAAAHTSLQHMQALQAATNPGSSQSADPAQQQQQIRNLTLLEQMVAVQSRNMLQPVHTPAPQHGHGAPGSSIFTADSLNSSAVLAAGRGGGGVGAAGRSHVLRGVPRPPPRRAVTMINEIR